MSLRRMILKHKGHFCAATLWCWRRPAGSLVVIPQDKNGRELGTFAINVCKKHKTAALSAAKEWAEHYEQLHQEGRQHELFR